MRRAARQLLESSKSGRLISSPRWDRRCSGWMAAAPGAVARVSLGATNTVVHFRDGSAVSDFDLQLEVRYGGDDHVIAVGEEHILTVPKQAHAHANDLHD